MKKAAIFVFYDRQGVIGKYVLRYLRGLSKVAQKIIFVSNGKLEDGELEKLGSLDFPVESITRENEGWDFHAYKEGIGRLKDKLSNYDELILCNDSCYGPVFPFNEIFGKMKAEESDFWGLTEWPENQGGYEGTWILSYFLAFNKAVFESDAWIEFWNNLPEIKTREEAIQCEINLSQSLVESGFKGVAAFRATSDYMDQTIEAPDELVINHGMPLIKRKAFNCDYERIITYHRGLNARRLLDYLKEHNPELAEEIYEDLVRNSYQENLRNNLQLCHILPLEDFREHKITGKAVVCMHVYYPDLLDRYLGYLDQVPDEIDLVITTSNPDLLDRLEAYRKKNVEKNIETRVIDSRGRAESAFLVATKDFIQDYDYACIVHDKKSKFLKPGCKGLEFGFHNLDNLIPSKDFIYNVLDLFEKNKRLGMLVPPNLLYGDFRVLYGSEWGANYDRSEHFLKNSFVDLPRHQTSPPSAPMGAMMWFRPKALKKLIEADWEYEDFPPEPLPLDGSFIHVLERTYPFFVQEQGYLTGIIVSDRMAENHIINLSHILRMQNQAIWSLQCQEASPTFKARLKKVSKSLFPRPYQLVKNVYYKFKSA